MLLFLRNLTATLSIMQGNIPPFPAFERESWGMPPPPPPHRRGGPGPGPWMERPGGPWRGGGVGGGGRRGGWGRPRELMEDPYWIEEDMYG